MADKLNIDGFSVSTANVCTAEGGFVGGIETGEAYTIDSPDGGAVRTFDPDTATLAELMDFVATLAGDILK